MKLFLRGCLAVGGFSESRRGGTALRKHRLDRVRGMWSEGRLGLERPGNET